MEIKMRRWKQGIGKIDRVTKESGHSIEDFFEEKNYEPKTEQEKQVFEEFSLITSTMAILIHVARADKMISEKEKERIIDNMTFQLEERPYEFVKLSEKFGTGEKGLILNIYDQILRDYQTDKIKLDKIISDICLIYQNNPEKRHYLIRLAYYVALSEDKVNKAEREAIEKIALRMKVPSNELKRIEAEVKLELAGR